MEGGAKILLGTLIFALCLGIAVVLLDKDYRPAKIVQTNQGIFSNIPMEGSGGTSEPYPAAHGELVEP